MTRDEANDLATRIRRESNVTVRTVLGRTNGEWLVHVINRESRRSVNITALSQWLTHDWNKNNNPTRARKPRNAPADVASEATIAEALNTVYSPED